MAGNDVVVALAGNPNSGKTSLFNALTGAHQKVANYPGVTVEHVEGRFEHRGRTYRVVDLPGTYSLSAMSEEERVARRFVAEERPDVVVHVVDSTNLERNLYLAVQLAELGANLVLALNMWDEAEAQGLQVDTNLLGKLLGGIKVVTTQANRGRGIEDLKEAVAWAAEHPVRPPAISRGDEVDAAAEAVARHLKTSDTTPFPKSWVAIKLLEGDDEVRRLVTERGGESAVAAAEAERRRIEELTGEEVDVVLADRRYGFISGLLKEAVHRPPTADRYALTERIDRIVTHRVFGFPIFVLAVYGTFWLTFNLGGPLSDLMDRGLRLLAKAIQAGWPSGSAALARSLVIDGIFGGVGAVLVFLPQVVILFMGLAILEDTGYMARAAFLMDRVMHRIGLHGKSFIPMIVGFGCNVPGILATRILEHRRDRLVTMFVLPLFSCPARLPAYVLVLSAFFPGRGQALALLGIYALGVLLAGIGARILRSTVLRGEDAPFVMELPPYRMPTLRALLLHAGRRSWMYLKKAGTIILAVSMVLWALSTFPRYEPHVQVDEGQLSAMRLRHSTAGRIGHAVEPALRLMGLDWRMGTAFLGAVAAKEVFISQLGIVLSVPQHEPGSLVERVRSLYTPAAGLAIIVFLLIAAPCMATFAAVKQESRSWRWPIAQWLVLTSIGYVAGVLTFQVGSILGL